MNICTVQVCVHQLSSSVQLCPIALGGEPCHPPPPPPAPRLCRMDSFVLAETFKYLYLLFAEEEELLLDMDGFIFNTEAHLLPLSLASGSGADWREVGRGGW